MSHPELLAHCGAAAAARRGPLHPLQPAVYSTLAALLQELQALFPDHAFHLGGDEVDLDCWYHLSCCRRLTTFITINVTALTVALPFSWNTLL